MFFLQDLQRLRGTSFVIVLQFIWAASNSDTHARSIYTPASNYFLAFFLSVSGLQYAHL